MAGFTGPCKPSSPAFTLPSTPCVPLTAKPAETRQGSSAQLWPGPARSESRSAAGVGSLGVLAAGLGEAPPDSGRQLFLSSRSVKEGRGKAFINSSSPS